MRGLNLILIFVAVSYQLKGQEQYEIPKFYVGVAFGTSFPIGDFGSTDISNPDAGFAKNGRRFDVYGGHFLNNRERTTLTGVFRYQTFETEIEDLIADLKVDDPNLELIGSTEDWQVYSLLVGLAYKVDIGSKFAFFPRFGMGPLWTTTPGITINAPNAVITQKFDHSSETGLGLGYELGIGLNRKLGKHFALMPTFTFSGGFVTVNDVVTTTDNITAIGNYQPTIQSFNIGLSLAYKIF
ncbi:MAG TPA: hypothetical protein PKA00_17040 [Saprospiraceae bacterium]|nr:hypothetical protein [Saprospiraceae bacterium]HMQ84625.1 hypothetical protein [Saprospiraceae bacterium]